MPNFRSKIGLTLSLIVTSFLLFTTTPISAQTPKPDKAIAVLSALNKSGVTGTIRFTNQSNGLLIVADIQGLKPRSSHGFHIHEFGDLSDKNGKSAGEHFNPTQTAHGGPDTDPHHSIS